MSPLQQGLLVGGLLILYGGSVVSHQLTPFFLLLDVILLVIVRRILLRGFPLVMTVIVFSFISYAAIGYWSGHFDEIFGGVGQVSQTAKANVGSKVETVQTNHVLVIYGRLLLSAALWATAAFGVFRRLRKGHTNITFLVCFAAPFLILGGQSYGGEAILRVFLFSLPFAATFAVFALLPSEELRLNAVRTGILCLVFIALGPMFFLARFGNEQFEYVSRTEYQAVQKLYDLAPRGSRLVAIDPNTPWRIENIEKYGYDATVEEQPLDAVSSIVAELTRKPAPAAFLYVSKSQVDSNSLRTGRPRNWDDPLAENLVKSGLVTLVFENRDARIFELNKEALSR